MQTMKAKIRRMLAWVLSVAMILPSFPVTAYAAQDEVESKGSVTMQVNEQESDETVVATGSVISLKKLTLDVASNGTLKATGTTGAAITFEWVTSGSGISETAVSQEINVQVATGNAVYVLNNDGKLTDTKLADVDLTETKATIKNDAEEGSAQLLVTVKDGNVSSVIKSAVYTVKPVIKSIRAEVKAGVQPVATGGAVKDYITVMAVYSDSSEKEVSADGYTVDPETVKEGKTEYTVALTADPSITTTVELTGETAIPVITAIKAEVKAEVTQPVATGGAVSDYITVTAVYSDKNEKEVSADEYTVDPETVQERENTYTVALTADPSIKTAVKLTGETANPDAVITAIKAEVKAGVEQPVATGGAVSDCITVTADYDDGSNGTVDAKDYTVNPETVEEGKVEYTVTLKADTKLTAKVTLEGKTAEQTDPDPDPDKVVLTKIAAVYTSKEEVAVGEAVDKKNIKVTASYSDESEKEVTDFTISPEVVTKVGANEIKVSYTEGEVTADAVVIVTGFKPAEVPDENFGDALRGLSVKNVTTNAGGKITDTIGYVDGDPSKGAEKVELELLVTAEDQKDIEYKFFANDRELKAATGAAVASNKDWKVTATVEAGNSLKAGNNTIIVAATKNGETIKEAVNIAVYEEIGLGIKNPLSADGKILVKEGTGTVKLLPVSDNYKKGYKTTAEVVSGDGASNKNGAVSISVKNVKAGTEVTVNLTATLYDTSKKGSTVKLVEQTIPVTILVQAKAEFLTIKSVAIVDETAAGLVDDKAKYNAAVKAFKKALTELSLEEGKNTIQLAAVVNPASGASVYAPVWASSNEKIATVDEKGLLTLHRTGGKVTISCTVGPKTAKLSFATTEDKDTGLSGIKVNMASKTSGNLDLYSQNFIGDIVKCIDLTYGKNKTVKCISGAAVADLEFTTSNAEVASVSGAVITANKVGSAKISVYAKESAKKVGTFNVKVVLPQYAVVNGTITQKDRTGIKTYGTFRAYEDGAALWAYVELEKENLPAGKKWSFKLEDLVGYYNTAEENPVLLNKSYALNLSKIKENTVTTYKLKLPNKQEMFLDVKVNAPETVTFEEMDGVLYAGTSGSAIAYFNVASGMTVKGVSGAAIAKGNKLDLNAEFAGQYNDSVAVLVSAKNIEKPGNYTAEFNFAYTDGTTATATAKLKVVALPAAAKFEGVLQTYKNPSIYGYLTATNISKPAEVTFEVGRFGYSIYGIKDFDVLGQKLHVGFVLYEDGALDYAGVLNADATAVVRELTQEEINSLANKKLVFTEVDYFINGEKAAKPVNITVKFASMPVVKLADKSVNLTMPVNGKSTSTTLTVTSNTRLFEDGMRYIPALLDGTDESAKLVKGTQLEPAGYSYNAKKKIYEYYFDFAVTDEFEEGALVKGKRTLPAKQYSIMLQDKGNQFIVDNNGEIIYDKAFYFTMPKITITYEPGHEKN